MILLALLLSPPAATFTSPPVSISGFGRPMDDPGLARVVGTGTPMTRLSALVNELGNAQSQWPGEDLRASLSNWFADGNVQALANMSLRNG